MFLLVSLCVSILALALLYVQTIRCPKLSLAILFVCSRRRTGRRGLSRCRDFNVQKRKAMQTATLGLFISSFTHFFVWHIDALTQFILINMNSINMCSRTLTNTLKEQLCEFAKRAFTNMYTSKEIRLKLSVFTVMVMYMLTQWYIQHYHRTSFYTIIKSTNRSTLLHKMRIGRIYLHWLAFT